MKELTLHATRSAFDTISDSFTYIRLYYKSLAKMMSIFVLAPLLLGAILYGASIATMFDFSAIMAGTEPDIDTMFTSFAGMGFGIFFLLISIPLMVYVIYRHMALVSRGEDPSAVGQYTDGMVMRMLNLIAFFALTGAAFFGFFFLLGFSLIALMDVWGVLMLFLLVFILFFSFATKLMMVPAAICMNGQNLFAAIGESFQLTRGFFWTSLGVFLLAAILFSLLSQMVGTPFIIVGMLAGMAMPESSALYSALFTAGYALLSVLQIFFTGGQLLAYGMHYFNLEERHAAVSLSSAVDALSTEPVNHPE
ncbi:MAG: hypothetical protein ACNA78_02735 [Balneolaceae bacterium]